MSFDQFRLYYKDAAGAEVPCVGVKYRVLQRSGNKEVCRGVTDAAGKTLTFGSYPNIDPPAAPGTGTIGNSLFGLSRPPYLIEVWDYSFGGYRSPDLHAEQPLSGPELSRATVASPPIVRSLRIKPYLLVRLALQNGNRAIANAPYIGYTVNTQGRKVAAADIDGKPVRGATGADGKTQKVFCEQTVQYVFSLPNTPLTESTKMLTPMVTGQTPWFWELSLKSQQAVSAPNGGATAQISGKISVPAILNAEDQELILLNQQTWDEFEAFSGLIESTMSNVHQARLDLSRALEAKNPNAIRQAEQALGLAEDKVDEVLNKNFSQKAHLQEVITFESYDRGRTTGSGGFSDRMGLRRRYIPRQKYEEMRRLRVGGNDIPLKVDMDLRPDLTGKAGGNSVKASHFDPLKFMESVKRITLTAKRFNWSPDPKVYDLIELGNNQFSETVRVSEQVEIDKNAQWLRFVTGAGASAETNWNPAAGRVGIQAQANFQAKLVLFEGKWTPRRLIPSRLGWQMHFLGEDLGAIRCMVQCEFYGFVGAKGALTGSVGVSIDASGKAIVAPQGRDRGDSLTPNFDDKAGIPRFEPAALNETAPKDLNGLSVKAEVFAGAEGGLAPSGELQWLPPEQRDFVAFGSLTLDVAVSAGAGASAQLHIFYRDGKFRVKASARLCWGVGAKGALDFVIDAGKVLEFVKWVYYQLLHAGFRALVYMAEVAFRALSQILFMVIAEDSEVGRWLASGVREIQGYFNDLNRRLENANVRNQMVNKINHIPDWLIYATPETRGMLLYAVTRHYPETHARNLPETKMDGWDPQVHFLPSHKEAVLNILRPVQTRSEWTNVMQHMTSDGAKRSDTGKAEGDVVRFLDYGWSLNNNPEAVFGAMNRTPGSVPSDLGNTYLQQYLTMRSKLIGEFPKGHRVALNGTPEYQMLAQLDGQRSELFAMGLPGDYWDGGGSGTRMA